jgi:hypothetical protein
MIKIQKILGPTFCANFIASENFALEGIGGSSFKSYRRSGGFAGEGEFFSFS